MENQFYRVRSAKDIILSVSLIIIGGILLFIPNGVGVSIGGLFILLIGALFLSVLKSVYKMEGSDVVYNKKELYFNQEFAKEIQKAVLSDPNSIDVSAEGLGKVIKLNIYYSNQSGVAYLRLYEYIPYSYEPLTDMIKYQLKDISSLIK